MRLGYVAKVHPEDHSVDLVMCDDGTRLIGVQVMSVGGSTRTGHVDLPAVPDESDPWSIAQPDGQDQKAVVAFSKAGPVVMGFLLPQISQMTFKDGKRRMNRHQSDVYHTVDGDGNAEYHHPSGAYIRFAESLDHEDLTNKNFDESFNVDRNTDKKPGLRISIKNTTIDIDGEGNVKIKSDNTVTVDTPLLEVPHGDVKASGVSLVHHVHGGVTAGGDTSGPPL